MTASKKTDNHDPRSKLFLRSYFLKKYHAKTKARVLDCCMGSGFIWSELQKKHGPVEYLGLDLKKKKGRLKIDSARYLEAGGWNHDCIDIDTYGSPWRHWLSVLKNAKDDVTVFLTIGLIRIGGGGSMQAEAKRILGIPSKTPVGIIGSLHEHAQAYCLAEALKRFEIVEAVEAESNGNAKYIGIRLKKIDTRP